MPRTPRVLIWTLCASPLGGCYGALSYPCEDDSQCVRGDLVGTCEPAGWCSFPDSSCPSDARYSPHAGKDLANECTPTGTGTGTSTGTTTTTDPTGSSESTGLPPECGNDVLDPGETCDDGNERNGDGCNNDCTESGQEDWTQTFDASIRDRGHAIAVGGELVSVAGMTTVGVGDSDIVVLTYDRSGASGWTAMHAGPGGGSDSGWGVAVDDAGSVVAVGREDRGGMAAGAAWLRKYDQDGGETFTRTYDTLGEDDARGVDVDAGLGIAVAGQSQDEAWIQRYTGDGEVDWTRMYAGVAGNGAQALGIAASAGGGVVVTGTEVGAGSQDLWVRTYSAAAAMTFEDVEAQPNDDLGHAAAFSIGGTFVIAGNVSGRGWLRRYTAAGLADWTESYLGARGDGAAALGAVSDGQGDIVVVGFELTAANGRDVWIRKYDAQGGELWTRVSDGRSGGDDEAHAVAVDADDNIYVTGYESDAGGESLFVRRYTP